MRVLITGASTALARLVAGQLLAAGHEVCGIAQRRHRDCDPRVALVCAPLDSAVLGELAADADAVIHLAPVEPGLPESGGIAGVVAVTHAAAIAGTRLLFCSHAAGDPLLYGPATELVTTSWGPTLTVRLAPLVGRTRDWAVCRTVAMLQDSHGCGAPVRVVHTDDVCRFLVRAVGSHRTGEVDLAGTDGLTYVAARRRLSALRDRDRRLRPWPTTDPEFRLLPLHRDWEFECGWSGIEAVADTAQSLSGYRLSSLGAVARGLPGPDDTLAVRPASGPVVTAGADAGEFDSHIDPRFPVFTASGSSDALPGPLTPMTLDLTVPALRAAHRATATMLGLPEPLATEWSDRAVAVFGHRLYVGVSIRTAIDSHHTALRQVLITRRLAAHRRGYRDRCAEFTAMVERADHPTAAVAALSDARLDARIRMLRNYFQHGWVLSVVGALHAGFPALPTPSDITATAHLAAETCALADLLRGVTAARTAAAAGDADGLRSCAPGIAARFDTALTRVGHRGPGEAELANHPLTESAGELLAAAALAAGTGAGAPPTPAGTDDTARQQAWDGTVRVGHQLRIALREAGLRLTARRALAAADDVFYLTCGEVLTPPVDTRLRVNRRRAERRRLLEAAPPELIDGTWTPTEDTGTEIPVAKSPATQGIPS